VWNDYGGAGNILRALQPGISVGFGNPAVCKNCKGMRKGAPGLGLGGELPLRGSQGRRFCCERPDPARAHSGSAPGLFLLAEERNMDTFLYEEVPVTCLERNQGLIVVLPGSHICTARLGGCTTGATKGVCPVPVRFRKMTSSAKSCIGNQMPQTSDGSILGDPTASTSTRRPWVPVKNGD